LDHISDCRETWQLSRHCETVGKRGLEHATITTKYFILSGLLISMRYVTTKKLHRGFRDRFGLPSSSTLWLPRLSRK
jgi:hypothetical protein